MLECSSASLQRRHRRPGTRSSARRSQLADWARRRDSSASIPTTRRSPPPCAPWSAPARGARPGIEARAQYDALMESVSPRALHTKQTPSAAYRDCGYNRRVGGQAKRSPPARGCSTLAPPRRTPIWSGRSPRRAERGLYPGKFGLLPNIHSGCPRTTCGHAYQGLAERATLHRIALTETPREQSALGLASRVTGAAASSNATLVGVAVCRR